MRYSIMARNIITTPVILSLLLLPLFLTTAFSSPSPSPAPSPLPSTSTSNSTSPSPSPSSVINSPPSPAPESHPPSHAPESPTNAPADAPESDDFPGEAPHSDDFPPAGAPGPVEADEAAEAANVDHKEEEDGKKGEGMNGGQKFGVVAGVLIGAGVVGVAGFIYKKRQDNVRRARYGGHGEGMISMV